MTTSRRSVAFFIGALTVGCTAPLILAEGPPEDVVPFIPETPPDASRDIGSATPRDDASADPADDDGGFDGIQVAPDASKDKG
ncbi:MAG: hypothetical protein KF850_42675 [Labilithrix sp.]|nr:hypothetical protein [Labilithrix sp.]MBX3218788.1 hypothetical protein [Labilithrix sp.]